MKNNLNFWTKCLVMLLSLLGFACDKSDDKRELDKIDIGREECLYGSPNAAYKVLGTVSNDDKSPIANAKVVLGSFDKYGDDIYSRDLDSTITNEGGNFNFNYHDYSMIDDFYVKTYADGYQADSIAFQIKELEGGDGSWFEGTGTKELKIVLKPEPKNDNNPTDNQDPEKTE